MAINACNSQKNDENYIENTTETLKQRYSNELDSGLLDILLPPLDFYPVYLNRTIDDPVFHDSPERIRWRQNQNFDVSFLMSYCLERGSYYLNLEDDILARPRFVTDVMQFVTSSDKNTKNQWLMLEFSQLGFIGKLFRTR